MIGDPPDKMTLRNAFNKAINGNHMYVIIRRKTEQGTDYHYIPRESRAMWQEYYEQHFWVTPESNGKLIDYREGVEPVELTGMTSGGSNAIVNIW